MGNPPHCVHNTHYPALQEALWVLRVSSFLVKTTPGCWKGGSILNNKLDLFLVGAGLHQGYWCTAYKFAAVEKKASSLVGWGFYYCFLQMYGPYFIIILCPASLNGSVWSAFNQVWPFNTSQWLVSHVTLIHIGVNGLYVWSYGPYNLISPYNFFYGCGLAILLSQVSIMMHFVIHDYVLSCVFNIWSEIGGSN